MKKGYYKCECGKEFNDSQKFNAHKRYCKIHLAAVGKSYVNIINSDKVKNIKALNRKLKKEKATQKWISEKHICEHCGKIMTEKFGSGRFCCRACANSRRHTNETKNKIAATCKLNTNKNIGAKVTKENAINKYNLNPKYCSICGKKIPYELRKRNTCSTECLHIQMHNRALQTVSTQHNNKVKYKWGTYKGICCDSSWELAYAVYCLDHNINIIRNKQGFSYLNSKQEQHTYFPDFVVDNTYIEIKNYITEDVILKQQQFPKELNYKILFKNDLKPILDYVITKYGKNFTEVLYE